MYIYTLGYPMNLVQSIKNIPICRMGCISYISHILKYELNEINYLIDSQTFPGSSGSPVIIKPELTSIKGTKPHSEAKLIGILHSYIPYREQCISVQTGSIRQTYEENSGLTLVYPVDLIVKIVMLERSRNAEKI